MTDSSSNWHRSTHSLLFPLKSAAPNLVLKLNLRTYVAYGTILSTATISHQILPRARIPMKN